MCIGKLFVEILDLLLLDIHCQSIHVTVRKAEFMARPSFDFGERVRERTFFATSLMDWFLRNEGRRAWELGAENSALICEASD